MLTPHVVTRRANARSPSGREGGIQSRLSMPETGNMEPPTRPSSVVTMASALTEPAANGVASIAAIVPRFARVRVAVQPILFASMAEGI